MAQIVVLGAVKVASRRGPAGEFVPIMKVDTSRRQRRGHVLAAARPHGS